MAAKEYPYCKSILLNAVYDTLDQLGFPIAFADSRTGILRFAHGTGAGELPGVLLDEISSTLRQSFESVTRRTTA